jgi:hypothetical protein
MKLWFHVPVVLDYAYGENVTLALNLSSGGEKAESPFSMKTEII